MSRIARSLQSGHCDCGRAGAKRSLERSREGRSSDERKQEDDRGERGVVRCNFGELGPGRDVKRGSKRAHEPRVHPKARCTTRLAARTVLFDVTEELDLSPLWKARHLGRTRQQEDGWSETPSRDEGEGGKRGRRQGQGGGRGGGTAKEKGRQRDRRDELRNSQQNARLSLGAQITGNLPCPANRIRHPSCRPAR